ncbi:hypothetical protein Tco_0045645 [Tanacetum coccineum]
MENQRIQQSPIRRYPVYFELPEQAPLSLEFVPEPVYPEFMPLEDEVFPVEEQPLPAAVSPTTDLPGYIANSDSEEDPEEDPTYYPADGGDDDDGDDESSDNDEDDDDDVEEDEDEEDEEEHPAPATLSHHLYTVLLLGCLSEMSHLHHFVLPPLPVSPSTLPASPTYLLGFRAAMIWQRAESPSTSHSLLLLPPIILSHTRASVAMIRAFAPSTYILAPQSETPPSETPPSGTPPLLPIPLPTLSPPLILPLTNRRENRRELNMLHRDRRAHARTALFIEREARLSCEAWGRSMDASDTARSEVRAMRTTVLAKQTEIAALQVADRTRQA